MEMRTFRRNVKSLQGSEARGRRKQQKKKCAAGESRRIGPISRVDSNYAVSDLLV